MSRLKAIPNGALRACALWVTAWMLVARLAPALPLPSPVRHVFENQGAVAHRMTGVQRTRSVQRNSTRLTARGLPVIASAAGAVGPLDAGSRVPLISDRFEFAAAPACRFERGPPSFR